MRRVWPVFAALAAVVLLGAAAAAHGDSTYPSVLPTAFAGAPIVADLNGDGIPDRATLGQIGGATSTTCTVTVAYGRADGTFGPSTVHTYTSIEKSAPFCPDVGAAVRLGNHHAPDLVTGFSFGFEDLMVLTRFRPVAIATGLAQPSFIRTADLNGDGRQDIIEGSNEGFFVATLINTRQATLVPGPIRFCTLVRAGVPQYVLADLNGDGGQDMVVSTFCITPRPLVSAQVWFGNGQQPVTLASTTDLTTSYTVFAIDLDYDGVPDVGVIAADGGTTTVTYFHNDGHGHFTPTRPASQPPP